MFSYDFSSLDIIIFLRFVDVILVSNGLLNGLLLNTIKQLTELMFIYSLAPQIFECNLR